MDAMTFQKGKIHDVVIRSLAKFLDERGWLAELFRSDETAPGQMPVMAYFSMTQPGVVRGPHEHLDQTDYFCFVGPFNFKVYLWDAREDSPICGVKQFLYAGRRHLCRDNLPSLRIVYLKQELLPPAGPVQTNR